MARLLPNIYQYISIYFTKSWFALVCHEVHQKQKLFCEWYKLDYLWPSLVMVCNAGTPSKKCFLQKLWFFRDWGFPMVILANKSLKASCLSSKMVYQHLLYLFSVWTYWHLKFTQGPTRFFNENFRGCWIANLASGLKWAKTAVYIELNDLLI